MADEITERGSLVPVNFDERITAIEKITDNCNFGALVKLGSFQRAFQLARGVSQLRELITPEMMRDIMALQNTQLGFKTDKQDGYEMAVVKECLIQARLMGAYPVGNEFNIISAQTYLTKNFFIRTLREFPGLTDLRRNFGVPKLVSETGAIVAVGATWKLDGRSDSISDREIPIRVNKGMGPDAILGKAHRKLDAMIYSQITGTEMTDGEADEDTAARAKNVTGAADTATGPAASRADSIAAKVKVKVKGNGNDAEDERAIAVANCEQIIEEIEALACGAANHILTPLLGLEYNLKALDLEQLEMVQTELATALGLLQQNAKQQPPKQNASKTAQADLLP